jgi:hypothetical protein
MRRKNSPPQISAERFVLTIVLSLATYYSIQWMILDL